MTRSRKTFTPAEATALLPKLRLHFGEVFRLQAQLADVSGAIGESADMLGPAFWRVEQSDSADLKALKREFQRLMAAINEQVLAIASTDAIVEDLRQGLVDFPSELAGRTVRLCWQFGEDRVCHYHEPGEGFGDRVALPGSGESRNTTVH